MPLSILLAKVIGISLVVKGIAAITRHKDLMKLVDTVVSQQALVFTISAIEFVAGLFLVFNHNIWVKSWEVIITIIAWMMVVEGGFFILFGAKAMRKFLSGMNKKNYYIYGGLTAIVLGAYLTYSGFSAV